MEIESWKLMQEEEGDNTAMTQGLNLVPSIRAAKAKMETRSLAEVSLSGWRK